MKRTSNDNPECRGSLQCSHSSSLSDFMKSENENESSDIERNNIKILDRDISLLCSMSNSDDIDIDGDGDIVICGDSVVDDFFNGSVDASDTVISAGTDTGSVAKIKYGIDTGGGVDADDWWGSDFHVDFMRDTNEVFFDLEVSEEEGGMTNEREVVENEVEVEVKEEIDVDAEVEVLMELCQEYFISCIQNNNTNNSNNNTSLSSTETGRTSHDTCKRYERYESYGHDLLHRLEDMAILKRSLLFEMSGERERVLKENAVYVFSQLQHCQLTSTSTFTLNSQQHEQHQHHHNSLSTSLSACLALQQQLHHQRHHILSLLHFQQEIHFRHACQHRYIPAPKHHLDGKRGREIRGGSGERGRERGSGVYGVVLIEACETENQQQQITLALLHSITQVYATQYHK